MAFTGKTAPRERSGSGRGRKRPKKNNVANLFFFLNSGPLFILSLMLSLILSLVPPPLFSPVLPPSPPLVPFPFPSGSPTAPPLILFFNPFYDTRPQAAGAP